MDIYIVIARCGFDEAEYYEKVYVLEDMVEKPKSYVGQGRRIEKNTIGHVLDGSFHGAYKMNLTDKDKINEARALLKAKVDEYVTRELNKRLKEKESIDNHSLESEIEFTKREW